MTIIINTLLTNNYEKVFAMVAQFKEIASSVFAAMIIAGLTSYLSTVSSQNKLSIEMENIKAAVDSIDSKLESLATLKVDIARAQENLEYVNQRVNKVETTQDLIISHAVK